MVIIFILFQKCIVYGDQQINYSLLNVLLHKGTILVRFGCELHLMVASFEFLAGICFFVCVIPSLHARHPTFHIRSALCMYSFVFRIGKKQQALKLVKKLIFYCVF